MIPYSNYYPEDWDENGNLINRDRIEVSKLIDQKVKIMDVLHL